MPFLTALLVSIAFVPTIVGGNHNPRWWVMAILLPWQLLFIHDIRASWGHVLGAVFLAWICLSLAWTINPQGGLGDAAHWLLLGAAFCLGSATENLRPLVRGAAIGIGINAAFAVLQWLLQNPTVLGNGYGWSGLFVNHNLLAEASVAVLIACIAWEEWYLLAGPVIALGLSFSRASLIALVVPLCFKVSRMAGFAVMALFVGVLAYVAVFHTDLSAHVRLFNASNILNDLVWNGHGAAGFRQNWVVNDYAHNDFLQAGCEFGIGALALVALCVHALLLGQHRSDSRCAYVLASILICACFGFSLQMPFTGFLGAVMAGHLCRRGNNLCTARATGAMVPDQRLAESAVHG